GTGVRFGEALAPHALTPQDARKMERALIVGALGDERWPRVHHADEVDADVRRVRARVLLEVDELLAHRQPATAERDRPMQSGVARVEELALPRGVVGAARGPVARRRRWPVPRHLDFEPTA